MSPEMNSLQNALILLSCTLRRKEVKYYAIILISTPNSSRVKQTTLLLSYQVRHESRFEIAQVITEAYDGHAIPFADCTAQGNDKAASMSG